MKACDSDGGRIASDLLGPIKDAGTYCAYFMLAFRECKWRPDFHFNLNHYIIAPLTALTFKMFMFNLRHALSSHKVLCGFYPGIVMDFLLQMIKLLIFFSEHLRSLECI